MTEIYTAHERTIKVKGSSNVRQTALYAMHKFSESTAPLEIVYVGANAGQQATKICGRIQALIEQSSGAIYTAAFQQRMVQTQVAESEMQIACVWTVHFIESDILKPPAEGQ